ncbi:hypothetical protein [Thiosocius teredinicola]|uniref:hypothetical protein n=1 Tax=Thiosocius teredinicola TaxID=1973002 RepID=UPI000F7828F8
MNTLKTWVSAMLTFCLAGSSLAAEQGSAIGLLLKTRQDVDYRLDSVGFSASLLTPIGLFRCDPSLLHGESRIDSFNNIVGISDVRDAEWKDFTARDLECRYGAKWDVAGGTLKAGIGFRDYNGATNHEPGGKDIRIKGAGALIDYDGVVFDAKVQWQREDHDYTLMHQASVGSYDSLVDAVEDTYSVKTTYKLLYLNAKHVDGNKDNVYTTPLFPTNRFTYAYTDVALGLRLNPEANGLTTIAPIFGGGSYRGSFNPLQGNTGLKGIELAGRVDGYNLELEILRHTGDGDRPYLPATQLLAERKKTMVIALAVHRNDWRVRLENARSEHNANATIASPVYAFILGGYGPFNNQRKENKWTLSASFPVHKRVTADLSLYYADRHDQQYNYPAHDYSEAGGFVLLTFPL